MEHKLCKKCGETKPLDQFELRKRPSGKMVPHTYCRPCRKQYNDEWKEKNRDKYAVHQHCSHVKRVYGLDYADFTRMMEEQNNRCAICGYEETRTAHFLHVDHCHESGKVRALLCGPCNRGMGGFRDNPEILRAAANYLEEHQ